jgi:hypothetical protein
MISRSALARSAWPRVVTEIQLMPGQSVGNDSISDHPEAADLKFGYKLSGSHVGHEQILSEILAIIQVSRIAAALKIVNARR